MDLGVGKNQPGKEEEGSSGRPLVPLCVNRRTEASKVKLRNPGVPVTNWLSPNEPDSVDDGARQGPALLRRGCGGRGVGGAGKSGR